MKKKPELDRIKSLLATGPVTAAPAADLLLGELRSDYGFPPAVVLPDTPPEDAVLVVWEYRICVEDMDAFHGLLQKLEPQLREDVKGMKVGASYYGTYAEAPQFTTHRTYWAYQTPEAVDAFKKALVKKANLAVLNGLQKLIAHIDCCCSLTLRRYYRAGLLIDFVRAGRKTDPILDLFAGKPRTKKPKK